MKYILLIPLFLFFSHSLSAKENCYLIRQDANTSLIKMSNYEVKKQFCAFKDADNEILLTGIRQLSSNGKTYVLTVDPNSLKTNIIDKSCLACSDLSHPQTDQSVYQQELKRIENEGSGIHNQGLAHAKNSMNYLTVDLCPSRNTFNYEIFENSKIINSKKFPVAFAISGYWIKNHLSELNWIKQQILNEKLEVLWVNHSYTHPYKPGIALENNFLLSRQDKFESEVLNQEMYMISNGLIPSVFFRFPGLVSNKNLIQKLSHFGLITLGSHTWIAKNQKVIPGSIILIHGNGNENIGVQKFINYLNQISTVESFKPLNLVLKS